MKKALCTVVALLGYVSVLSAQQLGEPRTPFEAVAQNRRYPKMTVAPDGRIVMTYIQEHGSRGIVYTALSSDDGLTWSAPARSIDVVFGTIGLQRQPYAVMDDAGIMHMVFEDMRRLSQIDVFHCRSTDDGQTWTEPVSVSDDPNGIGLQDFSSIAVGTGGTIVITFLDKRDALDPYRHIYITRSTDRGLSWSAPERVDRFDPTTPAGVCECCIQNVAIAPNGNVAVVFRSNIANQRDVHLAPSVDGGLTFGPPVRIASGTWTIDGCPSTGPTVVFDSIGSVHLAWMDERDAIGAPSIWHGRWAWMSFAVPINQLLMTSSESMPNWPEVATSANGNVVRVAWQTSNGVFVATSTDGGATFTTEPVDPRPGRQDFAHVVRTPSGRFVVAWQGSRDGFYDVYVTSDVPTSVDEPEVPTPTSDVIEYYDLLGRRWPFQPHGLSFARTSTTLRPLIK